MSSTWSRKFYEYSDSVFQNKKITHYLDGGGFSLIGEYSEGFKRRMGVGKDGNQVPFFKFIFDENAEVIDEKYSPLYVSVGLTARVIEDSKPRYMLNDDSIKHFRPVDFVSKDDFFINVNDGKVYQRKRTKYNEIDLSKLYSKLYKIHISDVITLKGVYRRIKMLLLRRLPSAMTTYIAWIFGWLTYFIKRDRYIYDVIIESYRDRQGDSREVIKPETAETNMDFFGYKVNVWTLYTFSFVLVIVYIIWSKSLIRLVPKNGLDGIFDIPFAVFAIVTYDRIIPHSLRISIKYLSIWSYELKYKSIKLKI